MGMSHYMYDAPSREPYVSAVSARSSLGSPAAVIPAVYYENPVVRVSGKTANVREKIGGKTGSLTITDCSDAILHKIEWEQGEIITEGNKTIRAGCDGGGSWGIP